MASKAQIHPAADWLDAACHVALQEYPQFRRVPSSPARTAVLALEGVMQPFTRDSDLRRLVPDLECGARVYVAGGILVHADDCRRGHPVPPYLGQLLGLSTEFQVRVLVEDVAVPPRAYCLRPFIAPVHFHTTLPPPPHTYLDGALCTYFPSTEPLPFDETRLLRFLDYTAIWLAKFLIWQRTGAFGEPRWIGPAADHSPGYLLAHVRPEWPCPCGKPLEYYRCCRDEHMRQFLQGMIGGK